MPLPGARRKRRCRTFSRSPTPLSDSHVEYHKFDIPKGTEVQLADLKGPGKVTYFYITDDNSLRG